jgi:hypothetical protein
MLPSGTLFLDRDVVYQDLRARYQAYALYDLIFRQVRADLDGSPRPDAGRLPFPNKVPCGLSELAEKRQERLDDLLLTAWHTVAEVAEAYPKLLVWLAQGKVSGLRNVFGALVAVARLMPGVRAILWHLMFKKVADRAPWRPALYEAVQQSYLRDKNQDAISPDVPPNRFGTEMDAPGAGRHRLSSVADVTVPMRTTARDNLRAEIVHMSSGCIGVGGLLGSGKSTIIRDICQHRYGTPEQLPVEKRSRRPPVRPAESAREHPLPGLRLVVHAPLRFEPREFVVHLYSCLCEAVLADPWFNKPSFGGNVLGPILLADSGRLTAVLGGLLAGVFLVAAAALGYFADSHGWWAPHWFMHDGGDWWAWAGAAVLLLVALIVIGRRTRNALLEVRQVIHLAVDAKSRLRRLRYQRTYTLSHGGSLNGPAGAGFSVGASREFAEQAMTLPELIDDYRDFAERVVAALVEKEVEREARLSKGGRGDVRLIIGIDEMDHIAKAEDACMFLDEISALFGTTNCIYLIAVSADALAATDRRTVALKTSSTGLFDEMVWVDALPFHEAAVFLDGIVSGMPAAVIALCYALSGGLPRELSRIARAVVGSGEGSPAALTVEQATRQVTNAEIEAFTRRAMASATLLDNGAAFDLLTPLSKLIRELTSERRPGRDRPPAQDLVNQDSLNIRVMAEARRLWATEFSAETAVTGEIVHSYIASLYFLLTVRDLFEKRTSHVSQLFNPGNWRKNPDPPGLRDLVDARAALSVSPRLAVGLVNEARAHLPGCFEQHPAEPALVAALR